MSVTDTEVGSAGHNLKVGECVCVYVCVSAREVAAFGWEEGSDLTGGGGGVLITFSHHESMNSALMK